MRQEIINDLINKSVKEADNIGSIYNYPSNLTHLLYLIIPAFIIKYGLENERYIFNSFKSIPILINDKEDNIYQAYYTSTPKKEVNEIKTTKGIVLNNYKNISLMQLLDNLVHEFNHAINSIHNEIKIDQYIKIRTGLTYVLFDKMTLNPVNKEDNSILEEVINTKQTESIIDIINSFSNYEITNVEVNNTLYSIKHSINQKYESNSYLIGSLVCKELMNNKTFISTVENLRFNGNIEDIETWFNDITSIKNSYNLLSKYLNKSLELARELDNTKWFKNRKITKIREINSNAMKIVDTFNRNCNYR